VQDKCLWLEELALLRLLEEIHCINIFSTLLSMKISLFWDYLMYDLALYDTYPSCGAIDTVVSLWVTDLYISLCVFVCYVAMQCCVPFFLSWTLSL